MDGSDLVSDDYVLQVSSPGERPLNSAADWRRFVGLWANVLAPDHGGRIEGKILGLEDGDGVGKEVAVLELNQKGRLVERRVPLADVKEARLAFKI